MRVPNDAYRAKAFELLTMSPPRTDINPYWRVDAIADALAAERAAAAREAAAVKAAVLGLAEQFDDGRAACAACWVEDIRAVVAAAVTEAGR